MTKSICRDRRSGAEVVESLCNHLVRPEPAVIPCNTHLCPSKWIAEEWSDCSQECGTGFRERQVVCAEEINGITTRLGDASCPQPKLATRESCNVHNCPKWDTSEWSGVSES